jgi:hypothetical protein
MHTRLVWYGASGQCKQSCEHHGVSHVSVSRLRLMSLPLGSAWRSMQSFCLRERSSMSKRRCPLHSPMSGSRRVSDSVMPRPPRCNMPQPDRRFVVAPHSADHDVVEHRAQLGCKALRQQTGGADAASSLAIIVYTIVTRPLLVSARPNRAPTSIAASFRQLTESRLNLKECWRAKFSTFSLKRRDGKCRHKAPAGSTPGRFLNPTCARPARRGQARLSLLMIGRLDK